MATQVTCTVSTPRREYEFKGLIHRANSPTEQKIEPRFYQGIVKTLYTGIHHETEIVAMPVDRAVVSTLPIRIHKNHATQKEFVCWVPQVEELEEARGIFRQWCVGTVYTIEYKEDFVQIAYEHPADFLDHMRTTFGITIQE
jgi:hypothetical protein